MKIVPVLLAGGIGERFWPMSRSTMPKQLLPLLGKKTMIEETLDRVKPFCRGGVRPLIVTGKTISSAMRQTIPEKVKYDSIVEPVGKNTAPAVAAAAAWINKKYGESVMLVLSADHAITPARAFIEAARYAVAIAIQDNALTVFGIAPSRPDTGYGYVQIGKQIGTRDDIQAYRVRRFVEKPGPAKAKAYLKSGKYLWNSGMFVWSTQVIMSEIQRHMPTLYKQMNALAKGGFTASAVKNFYTRADKESIDYGVMERSDKVAVVCGSFNWDDIGSWEAMSRLHSEDGKGVTSVGRNIHTGDCAETIIVNASPVTVAAFGVKDLVVVATGDAIMLTPRSKLPEIKKHLEEMKSAASLPKRLF